jgi:rhamnose transport system permease protein
MTIASLPASSPPRFRLRREISVLLAYLAILAVLAIFRPTFFHSQFRLTLVSTAPLLVAATGMTLVILAGQIDISIGSQFSVCTVIAGALAAAGAPLPIAAIGAIIAGALFGAINGLLVATLRLPSIVATLATMVILRGGLLWITGGAAVHPPDGFQWLGLSQSSGRAAIVMTSIVIFLIAAVAMRWLRGARTIYAVGSDVHAARLAGIRLVRVIFAVFVLSGALAGVAAVLGAVQFPMIYSNTGDGLELQVIAAVVVGGCAITGGRGTLAGTLFGVALLGVIASAQQFLGTRPEWARAVQGAIILLAVFADSSKTESR